MWNLFVLLIASFAVGLMILYGINYIKDRKGFDFWENMGQVIVRLVIGAVASLIIALCVEHSWVIWAAMATVAFLSNYWMKWLDKKRG